MIIVTCKVPDKVVENRSSLVVAHLRSRRLVYKLDDTVVRKLNDISQVGISRMLVSSVIPTFGTLQQSNETIL